MYKHEYSTNNQLTASFIAKQSAFPDHSYAMYAHSGWLRIYKVADLQFICNIFVVRIAFVQITNSI